VNAAARRIFTEYRGALELAINLTLDNPRLLLVLDTTLATRKKLLNGKSEAIREQYT